MNPMTIGLLFTVSWLLFAIPAGVLLLLAYLRSKLSGLLWLFFAVAVWPLFGRVAMMAVNFFAPRIMAERGLPWNSGPFGMNLILEMNLAESVVSGALLLAAAVVLYRNFTSTSAQPVINPYLPR